MLVEDLQRQNIEESLQKTLGDSVLFFEDEKISVVETQNSNETAVNFSFFKLQGGKREQIVIDCIGNGFIDAIYKGLMSKFAQEYRSLAQIRLNKFLVSTTKYLEGHTAANVRVSLQFEISKNNFTFSNSSTSIIRSAFCNLLKTFEFYINCENAFFMLQRCVEDAKSRNRFDIISECSYKMSNLTRMVSYEELCK